jgi:hypothetical protein
MCVMISSTHLSETFPILRRNERHTSINVQWSSCSVSVTLIRFQLKPNVVDRFSKNTQISNFMKICLVAAKFYTWTDRRTDRREDYRYDEAKSLFRKFANAPKNETDKRNNRPKTFTPLCNPKFVMCSQETYTGPRPNAVEPVWIFNAYFSILVLMSLTLRGLLSCLFPLRFDWII